MSLESDIFSRPSILTPLVTVAPCITISNVHYVCDRVTNRIAGETVALAF